MQNKNTTEKVPSEAKECILESIFEPKWITDDTIQIYFDLLNSTITPSNMHLLNPAITMAVKKLDDFESILQP